MTGPQANADSQPARDTQYGDDTTLAEPAIGAPGGLATALPGGPPSGLPGGQACTGALDEIPEQRGETTTVAPIPPGEPGD